jgi:hypothetical protein
MITTHNNIFYINTLSYNKNNNIYNTNNTIFDLNTLNYKKKIIIFITHIIILTHVIECGRVQPTLGLGMDASTRGYVPQGGTGVCLAQWSSPSARWRLGLPCARVGPPMRHVVLGLPCARAGQPQRQLSLRG